MENMYLNAKKMNKLEDILIEKTKNLKNQKREILITPFGVCHNNFILCIELMDCWLQFWDNPDRMKRILGKALKDLTEGEVKQLRNQNFERIMELLKWSLFIPTFSLIEFTMKNSLFLFSDHPAAKKVNNLKDKPHYIKFNNSILLPSGETNLLTSNQIKEIKTLAKLRNSIVHNNAIAQEDHIHKGENYEINFAKGEMLTGKLNTFFYCTLAVIELYFAWANNLLES